MALAKGWCRAGRKGVSWGGSAPCLTKQKLGGVASAGGDHAGLEAEGLSAVRKFKSRSGESRIEGEDCLLLENQEGERSRIKRENCHCIAIENCLLLGNQEGERSRIGAENRRRIAIVSDGGVSYRGQMIIIVSYRGQMMMIIIIVFGGSFV